MLTTLVVFSLWMAFCMASFEKTMFVKKEVHMAEIDKYNEAVKTIKTAILQSQYEAAKSVNEKQLALYFSIGRYISLNTRSGHWGQGAIEQISKQLDKELPGLRGFTSRNLRYMRTFYEEWSFLEEKTILLDDLNSDQNHLDVIRKSRFPKLNNFSIDCFLSIGFRHHLSILTKIKDIDERVFFVNKCATEHLSYRELEMILRDGVCYQCDIASNNFGETIISPSNKLKALEMFKDSYLLDFINVEELGERDKQDIDERVVEQEIVHNIKKFILKFGDGFAFIGNQYHLDAFGVDQYVDLLFFNRNLNCLVAVELKKGVFKTSYLGQLSGYLSILDKFERKPHENPSIGIILCKDMDKSFVDFVIHDYAKPMGVSTYKTSKDMSDELKKSLPDIEELRKLIDSEDD